MIVEFQGEYRWLSNFATCNIMLDGRSYRSVEHAYMSAKSNDPEWKDYCQKTVNPGDVKRASKYATLIKNWEDVKVSIMEGLLRQKYNQSPYKEWLIATGEEPIQEGNRWHDTFWGIYLPTGKGQNVLGKLIMKIRDEIQN